MRSTHRRHHLIVLIVVEQLVPVNALSRDGDINTFFWSRQSLRRLVTSIRHSSRTIILPRYHHIAWWRTQQTALVLTIVALLHYCTSSRHLFRTTISEVHPEELHNTKGFIHPVPNNDVRFRLQICSISGLLVLPSYRMVPERYLWKVSEWSEGRSCRYNRKFSPR